MSSRNARGVFGALPLVVGGFILLLMPFMKANAGVEIALLVAGTGITGAIYVVCAPMISEFTPTSQRGAVISIYGAIYTFAGIIAPSVMGSLIQNAATPLDGYISGFLVNGVILIVSGSVGLLLLWPDTELARLRGTTLQPRLA
jgi:MFS family permease